MTVPTHSIDFHAHHSPLGAYATFTCGRFGAGGGLRIADPHPPGDELAIGWLEEDGTMHVLPFYRGAGVSDEHYAESADADDEPAVVVHRDDVTRDLGGGSDVWTVGDCRFAIHTPVWSLPDPDVAGEGALHPVLLPAIVAEVTLDNRAGTSERTALFSLQPGTCAYQASELVSGGSAVAWGGEYAIAAVGDDAEAWVHWSPQDWHRERRDVLLGPSCGVSLAVPAGECRTLKVVLGTWRDGMVTTGQSASFYYRRGYASLGQVLQAGVERWDALAGRAQAMDAALVASGLDENQQFLIAHAERSYWGNTQLLDMAGEPAWVVYEGEYAMMNTFDLSVDQVFYELKRNPWVVRNLLDQFANRYAYRDQLVRPAPGAVIARGEGMERDATKLWDLVPKPAAWDQPGGVSFCHDMGVLGHFTPPGHSSYECSKLTGCFSYMTAEQLTNWILVATSYVITTGDDDWLRERAGLVAECYKSLLHRDDPVEEQRNGLVSLDSSRCEGGWEITTYDSLDPSLGQARDNLYIAVKCFASWIGLELLFNRLGELKLAVNSQDGARRVAAAIAKRFDPDLGFVPAVLDGANQSAIIPAIEGLVFPRLWQHAVVFDRQGPYGAMLDTLQSHLQAILREGVCLFADGGWKLSSTAENSWLSKIFISQHVAADVFDIEPSASSHAAHAHWQQVGSADYAMCDQVKFGKAVGSRYYPRCVTNDLWWAATTD